jgi:PAS domain S-box-containing protein
MPKKALVVDSDFFFVEFLSRFLEKRGFRVLKAYNGKEGLSRLKEGPIDLLFADLILPKVDGRQFFRIIRQKYSENRFPLVAVSGIVLEHMGTLDEIGADYYIAKGPIAQLTRKLDTFLADLTTKQLPSTTDTEIVAADNVYPRRDAMELLEALRFQQAVTECAGAGIIIVDTDTRVIHANQTAIEIIGWMPADVVNSPVNAVFSNTDRAIVADGLKQVMKPGKPRKVSFWTTFRSKRTGTVISAIIMKDKAVGWAIVLVPELPDKKEPSTA